MMDRLRLKVLLISDVDVETGRGPVTRLRYALPELSRRADIAVVALGEPDAGCAEALERTRAPVHPAPFVLDGWRVRDLPAVLAAITAAVDREAPDLVVLYREIWDLMHALPPVLRELEVPFLVMPHSVPFLDAMARPTRSFWWDLLRRLTVERRRHALSYLATHVHQVGLMRTLPCVVINETVEEYLKGYFPTVPVVRAVPGYAIDTEAVAAAAPADKVYDVAFMAKLTREKGLFDALRVLGHLRRLRPDGRMVVIGSFEDDRTRDAFTAARDRLGLADAVDLTGWLTGAEKYKMLGSARTFCYPSRSADTFSQCLLEALAAGLPAVTYDVPFARAIYGGTPAVSRVRFGDARAAATRLDQLLDPALGGPAADAARAFAGRYGSWSDVAEAEIAAYHDFLRRIHA